MSGSPGIKFSLLSRNLRWVVHPRFDASFARAILPPANLRRVSQTAG